MADYTTPGFETNGEMVAEGRFAAPIPTFGIPIYGESMLESSALEADGIAGLVTTITMGPTGQGATYAWAHPRGGQFHSHLQDGVTPAIIIREPQT
jgi:hypothetical protein